MKKQTFNKTLKNILTISCLCVAPTTFILPVAIAVKNNTTTTKSHADLTTSENILQSYQVRVLYTIDINGFVKMMNDAKIEYLNQFGINYTNTQIKNWFNQNTKKAIETIIEINARTTQRGFWSSIWSGIKGVGQAIAGGIVKTLDVATGESITAFHDTANDLLNSSADSFSDAKKQMNSVNWGEVGMWWVGVGTNALTGTVTNILAELAADAEKNNVLIPDLIDSIKKNVPAMMKQQIAVALPQLSPLLGDFVITPDEVADIMLIEKYNDAISNFSDDMIVKKTYNINLSTASYLYGTYNFKISFDLSKGEFGKKINTIISSLPSDEATYFTNLINGERLVSITITNHA